jgi:hypothetical protein
MPLTLDTKLQAKPDVIVTELADREGKPEAVLLNIATHKYFSLNASGIRIWKVLAQGQPLSAAVTDLTASFEVPRERAEASVLRLADELLAADLVTAAGEVNP